MGTSMASNTRVSGPSILMSLSGNLTHFQGKKKLKVRKAREFGGTLEASWAVLKCFNRRKGLEPIKLRPKL
jgi:hypothetical protein